MSGEVLVPWADQRTPALPIVARGDQIRPVTPVRFEVRSQSRPDHRYAISIRRTVGRAHAPSIEAHTVLAFTF